MSDKFNKIPNLDSDYEPYTNHSVPPKGPLFGLSGRRIKIDDPSTETGRVTMYLKDSGTFSIWTDIDGCERGMDLNQQEFYDFLMSKFKDHNK